MITTRGWGGQSVSVHGWGGDKRKFPLRRGVKNFILFIKRVFKKIRRIEKVKEVISYIEQNKSFAIMINWSVPSNTYIERQVNITLQIGDGVAIRNFVAFIKRTFLKEKMVVRQINFDSFIKQLNSFPMQIEQAIELDLFIERNLKITFQIDPKLRGKIHGSR